MSPPRGAAAVFFGRAVFVLAREMHLRLCRLDPCLAPPASSDLRLQSEEVFGAKSAYANCAAAFARRCCARTRCRSCCCLRYCFRRKASLGLVLLPTSSCASVLALFSACRARRRCLRRWSYWCCQTSWTRATRIVIDSGAQSFSPSVAVSAPRLPPRCWSALSLRAASRTCAFRLWTCCAAAVWVTTRRQAPPSSKEQCAFFRSCHASRRRCAVWEKRRRSNCPSWKMIRNQDHCRLVYLGRRGLHPAPQSPLHWADHRRPPKV